MPILERDYRIVVEIKTSKLASPSLARKSRDSMIF
jgi:hypothetical protein